MKVSRLVIREIGYRKLNFLLSLLSVTIAVASLVGAQTLLHCDDLLTEHLFNQKRAEVEVALASRRQDVADTGKELQDSIRKQLLGLGFNVLIVAESQDLADLHLTGTLTETMPESYVNKLAESDIVTINHLLPSVTKRVEMEHGGRRLEVILQGTRGEVPIMHRQLKKPLLDAVAPGTLVAGFQVHQKLGLSQGDIVALLGKEFEVTRLHPERGSTDDVTIWIDLRQAQEILGMENLIHAILALECECAGDRISQIREEIAGILPGTIVIERYSQAITRAEARAQAKLSAEEALRQESENGRVLLAREESARADIESRHAQLVAVLVPLVLVGCVIWIGFLAFGNARQRIGEIGVLRAIGLRSGQILALLLSRAIITGLVGGILGCGAGLLVGSHFGGLPASTQVWHELSASSSLLLTVLLSPLMALALSTIASWLPAVVAARQDPAIVLQRE